MKITCKIFKVEMSGKLGDTNAEQSTASRSEQKEKWFNPILKDLFLSNAAS